MPELAFGWLVGATVTFLSVNFNLYWVHRTFQSPAFKTLNHNLSKVNRYWSLEQGRLISYEAGQDREVLLKKDYQKSTRSAFLFGTLLIFLSWLGLILFALYFVSMHKLAKSRLEQRIFESELIRNSELSAEKIKILLVEMES